MAARGLTPRPTHATSLPWPSHSSLRHTWHYCSTSHRTAFWHQDWRETSVTATPSMQPHMRYFTTCKQCATADVSNTHSHLPIPDVTPVMTATRGPAEVLTAAAALLTARCRVTALKRSLADDDDAMVEWWSGVGRGAGDHRATDQHSAHSQIRFHNAFDDDRASDHCPTVAFCERHDTSLGRSRVCPFITSMASSHTAGFDDAHGSADVTLPDTQDVPAAEFHTAASADVNISDLHTGARSCAAAAGAAAAEVDVTERSLDPTRSVGPWCEVQATWPRLGNIILALHDDSSVVVYAAFNKNIAAW
jgi:hypothetical protein